MWRVQHSRIEKIPVCLLSSWYLCKDEKLSPITWKCISAPTNEKHHSIFWRSSNIQEQILNLTSLWGRMDPELESCLQQLKGKQQEPDCRSPTAPSVPVCIALLRSHHPSTEAQQAASTTCSLLVSHFFTFHV